MVLSQRDAEAIRDIMRRARFRLRRNAMVLLRVDVYDLALEFLVLANGIIEGLPSGGVIGPTS